MTLFFVEYMKCLGADIRRVFYLRISAPQGILPFKIMIAYAKAFTLSTHRPPTFSWMLYLLLLPAAIHL